jgi:RimJ/RimL family protein N-acetyltransferase
MQLSVRAMAADEADLIVDYFHDSTPEHLEMLGVDPTRLPGKSAWRKSIQVEFELPIAERSGLIVVWLRDNQPIGFSTSDKITFGEQANMHLHLVKPKERGGGTGAECLRRSADIYFATHQLKRLYCEPNTFNVAPNRALQKAGFAHVMTHMTVPGPLNYHKAVTRWVLER